MPQVFRELVVFNSLDYKFANNLYPAFEALSSIKPHDVCISTQSATNLSSIPANSIDYIFTDPPYADKVQYGELNLVWEAWLGFDTNWHDEEIIVNEVRGKSTADWEALMKKAMAECFRVLETRAMAEPLLSRYVRGHMGTVQDIMAEVGFIVDKTDSTLFIGAPKSHLTNGTADKTDETGSWC